MLVSLWAVAGCECGKGSTLQQVDRGVAGVASVINVLLFTLAPTIFQLAVVCVVFWRFKIPTVTACLVLSAVLYIAFTFYVTKKRIPQRKDRNMAANVVNSHAVDSLLNFETVKYFSAEHMEANRYDHARQELAKRDVVIANSLAALNVGQSLIVQAGLVCAPRARGSPMFVVGVVVVRLAVQRCCIACGNICPYVCTFIFRRCHCCLPFEPSCQATCLWETLWRASCT